MYIKIDPVSFDFKIEVNENDLPKIRRLENLVKHEDWPVLAEVYFNIREAYLKVIKNVKNSDANARAAWIKSAVFKGFDETADVPKKIFEASLEIQDKEEENEPDPADAGWVGI